MIRGIALLTLVLFLFGFALGDPKHTTVSYSAQKVGKDEVELTFKVVIKPGMMANFEKTTPWQLVLKEMTGLQVEKEKDLDLIKFDAQQLDQKLPGYKIKLKTNAPQGNSKYELRAFVCTVDKKQCFPEIHRGEIAF